MKKELNAPDQSERLQFTHANLDAIINSTSDLIWSVDKNLKLVTANQSFHESIKRLTGITLSEGDNVLIKGAYKPATLQIWKKRYRAALSGISFKEEEYLKPFDTWSEISFNPVYSNGNIIGCACFTRNITERKKAAEELRQLNERYILATTATADAIWDWNIATNELDWSIGYEELFGYSLAEQELNIETWTKRIHTTDKRRVKTSIRKAIDTPNTNYWQCEYKYIKADNSIAFVFDRGYLLRNTRGKAVRMVGGMQDITLRKIAEEEIKSLNNLLEQKVKERTAELEESNKDLESFSYYVSHDLRAPIRSIQSFSDLLLSKGLYTDDRSKEYLDIISNKAKKMGTLIDDLLRFSRYGRNAVILDNVDMQTLAEEVVNDFRVLHPDINTQIKIGPLHHANCSKLLITQVLTNLVSNAVKYSSKKSNPKVEIGCKKNGGETIYYVKDNGAGFDMKYADKLFNAFTRLHSDFDGTGVGLALSARIIAKHGGKIWAEAKPDKGATFFFTLH